MIRNKIYFLTLLAIHFLIAIGSSFLSFVWQMSIIDDMNPHDTIPWGLYVVNSISEIFTAPIFLLFGHQILNLSSLWLIALIILLNSVFVSYLLAFIWERFLKSKDLASIILVTVLVITLITVAMTSYLFLKQEQGSSVSTSQSVSNLNSSVITIIAPNGGEVFKIDSIVRVSWVAKNVPSEYVGLRLEVWQISGDKPIISATGQCSNCIGGNIITLDGLANGVGSVDWEVGKKLYPMHIPPGPGNNYVLLAVAERGNTDAESKQRCKDYPSGVCGKPWTVELGRDYSDRVFSITN